MATLPADNTLANGVGVFAVTDKTVGLETLTATDKSNSSITGSATTNVSVAVASHFGITTVASTVAGKPFTVVVTALSASNAVATGYSGIVHLTSSDIQAGLALDSALTNGIGTFAVYLGTAGSQTITATDTVTQTINGTSSAIAVSAGPAKYFTVGVPGSATAGTPFNFTVTAFDAYGNTASGYSGTFKSHSSDASALLPGNSTLTNGTGTFSATLKTAGTQTLTATDLSTSSITGSAAIAVTAGPASALVVSGPSSAVAGQPFVEKVTATDTFGNVAAAYVGTVHFTSTDPLAVLPADATLTNGVGHFAVTLNTAGNQTITTTDKTNSSLSNTTAAITVAAGLASHFVVTAGAGQKVGTPFQFTVTALDAANNVVIGYTGTVNFGSGAGAAALPGNSMLVNGQGIFNATLQTAGVQAIAATDVSNAGLSGSVTVSASAGAAATLVVNVPSSSVAGQPIVETVIARDQFGNIAAGYSGTLHFSSTDLQAVLPADTTLTNGIGYFAVALNTAGNQTITATDKTISSLSYTTAAITVAAGLAAHFAVTASASQKVGTPFQFTVTALDTANNVIHGYTGTVYFASRHGAAVLPANSTLTNGQGIFNATLQTAGVQAITVTDVSNAGLSGSVSVSVSPGAATTLVINVPSSSVAGQPIVETVIARDQAGNIAAGYSGTVHFSSTDLQAALPPDATLTNGIGYFAAILRTAGSQTISVTDVANGLTGSTSPIAVSPAATNHFSVTAPATAITGAPFNVIVRALDAFNNVTSGYTGTVHLSSSDAAAMLSSDSTLSGGVGTFSATLGTPGNQTLSVADDTNAAISGVSNAVATRGLQVTSLTPTPSGFTATFNKPFNPSALTIYDGGAPSCPTMCC